MFQQAPQQQADPVRYGPYLSPHENPFIAHQHRSYTTTTTHQNALERDRQRMMRGQLRLMEAQQLAAQSNPARERAAPRCAGINPDRRRMATAMRQQQHALNTSVILNALTANHQNAIANASAPSFAPVQQAQPQPSQPPSSQQQPQPQQSQPQQPQQQQQQQQSQQQPQNNYNHPANHQLSPLDFFRLAQAAAAAAAIASMALPASSQHHHHHPSDGPPRPQQQPALPATQQQQQQQPPQSNQPIQSSQPVNPSMQQTVAPVAAAPTIPAATPIAPSNIPSQPRCISNTNPRTPQEQHRLLQLDMQQHHTNNPNQLIPNLLPLRPPGSTADPAQMSVALATASAAVAVASAVVSPGGLPPPRTGPLPPLAFPYFDESQAIFVTHLLEQMSSFNSFLLHNNIRSGSHLAADHHNSHFHHLHQTQHHQHQQPSANIPAASQNEEPMMTLSDSKPRGLTRAEIESLTAYTQINEKDPRTCVICLSKFELKSKIRPLSCQHAYHAKCVDKWLKANRTCPICRRDALKGYSAKIKKLN